MEDNCQLGPLPQVYCRASLPIGETETKLQASSSLGNFNRFQMTKYLIQSLLRLPGMTRVFFFFFLSPKAPPEARLCNGC